MVGLGACPYAPGSKGNVATERVVELMKQLGYETNLELHLMLGNRGYKANSERFSCAYFFHSFDTLFINVISNYNVIASVVVL